MEKVTVWPEIPKDFNLSKTDSIPYSAGKSMGKLDWRASNIMITMSVFQKQRELKMQIADNF